MSGALCVRAVKEVHILFLIKMKCSQECDSFHGPRRFTRAQHLKKKNKSDSFLFLECFTMLLHNEPFRGKYANACPISCCFRPFKDLTLLYVCLFEASSPFSDVTGLRVCTCSSYRFGRGSSLSDTPLPLEPCLPRPGECMPSSKMWKWRRRYWIWIETFLEEHSFPDIWLINEIPHECALKISIYVVFTHMCGSYLCEWALQLRNVPLWLNMTQNLLFLVTTCTSVKENSSQFIKLQHLH